MKSISIGCTVNLESYENLRVDITDTDADRALALMDETLARLGRSDPKASAAIDSYRQRVFGGREHTESHTETHQESTDTAQDCASEPISTPPIVEDTPEKKPSQKGNVERIIDPATLPRVCDKCGVELKESEAVSSAVFANGKVRCVACRYPGLDTDQIPPNTSPTPAKEPAPKQEPKPETPAKESNSDPTTFVCEACGIEIAKIQHDVSQLFMKQDLCRPCMEKPQGGSN